MKTLEITIEGETYEAVIFVLRTLTGETIRHDGREDEDDE